MKIAFILNKFTTDYYFTVSFAIAQTLILVFTKLPNNLITTHPSNLAKTHSQTLAIHMIKEFLFSMMQ